VLSEKDEKLKKNYEEFLQMIEKESKKEIPLPPKFTNASILKELQKNSIEQEMNKV
jgi:hypothetical protein